MQLLVQKTEFKTKMKDMMKIRNNTNLQKVNIGIKKAKHRFSFYIQIYSMKLNTN